MHQISFSYHLGAQRLRYLEFQIPKLALGEVLL